MRLKVARGYYLLGAKGPAAAIRPPPGVFFSNDIHMYSGDLGGGKELPTGGRFVGVTGKAAVDTPTVLWLLPDDVLGGNVGPVRNGPVWVEGYPGRPDDCRAARGNRIRLGCRCRLHSRRSCGRRDAWMGGWKLSLADRVAGQRPDSDYQEGEISNIAFHPWGADIPAAFTWRDPCVGVDLSATVGMTFDVENPATDHLAFKFPLPKKEPAGASVTESTTLSPPAAKEPPLQLHLEGAARTRPVAVFFSGGNDGCLCPLSDEGNSNAL